MLMYTWLKMGLILVATFAIGALFVIAGIKKKRGAEGEKQPIKEICAWSIWAILLIGMVVDWIYLGIFQKKEYNMFGGTQTMKLVMKDVEKQLLLGLGSWMICSLLVWGLYFLVFKIFDTERSMAVYTLIMTIVFIAISVGCGKEYWKIRDNYRGEVTAYRDIVNGQIEDWLEIDGTSQVYYDRVERDSTVYNNRATALINVYFYNYYYDNDITYEELIRQYENFCAGKSKKTYKDMWDFALVMWEEYYNTYNITPDRIHAGKFTFKCEEYLPDDYCSNPEWTDERIYEICDMVMANMDDLYISYLVRDLYRSFNYDGVRLLDRNFDNYEIKELDTGEKVIEVDGALCYLKEGVFNYQTQEPELYVYKIVQTGESEDVFIFGKIGLNKEEILVYYAWNRYSFFGTYDFPIVSETENQVVRECDGLRQTVDYEDGLSVRITLEVIR